MNKEKAMRQVVFDYVKKKYKSEIEYLWENDPSSAIFRHNDNRKWYGIVMNIPKSKLGFASNERVDILNVKCGDPLLVDMLIQNDGYFPAYHQTKGKWVTIILDGTVSNEDIFGFIDMSFRATAPKMKNKK